MLFTSPIATATESPNEGPVPAPPGAQDALTAHDEVPNKEPVILPVTFSEPEIFTFFVEPILNTSILADDIVNISPVPVVSDTSNKGPLLPEIVSMLEPLPCIFNTCPIDDESIVLPLTSNLPKLPVSVKNVAIYINIVKL